MKSVVEERLRRGRDNERENSVTEIVIERVGWRQGDGRTRERYEF